MSTTAKDWGEGYVVDVDYVDNFHPGLVPINLAFAALLGGVVPPDVDRPFTYLDLGCGNGFTAALIAAAYPHAEIWGADFNPAHIRNARATADAAGLGNVRFVEASFAAMLDMPLPQFDFVVAHGIWSWISGTNRDRVAALFDRIVKPGGLVMVSYNCHPGWDPLLPLRRLLFAAGTGGTDPLAQVDRALDTARRLRDAGAWYFRDNPGASEMLDALGQHNRAYVAHEYLNAEWTLFYPEDVAEALAPASLRRIGSARTIDAFDRLWFTEDQLALLRAETESEAAPMLRDLILDRRFRLDLFVRDGTSMDQPAKAAWYAARRFVLARSRAECSLTVRTKIGETTMPAMPAERLLDALAAGPATGAELATLSELAGTETQAIEEALSQLVAIGNVRLALSVEGEPARRASTDRFNAAALAAARKGEPLAAMASPVTGSGEAVSESEQLMLDAIGFGIPIEAITIGDGDGTDRTARFRDHTLPTLAMLGIA